MVPLPLDKRGCIKCRFTAYHSRTAVTELVTMSNELRDLTIKRRHATEIDTVAKKHRAIPLLQSGIEKVHNGHTTYEEVLRVTKGTV